MRIMSANAKQESGEAVITVRLPKGLKDKVETRIQNRFSTMSEYIRDLIRRDVLAQDAKHETAVGV